MSLGPGSTIHGRYHLESELGRGGMGWLFRARDTLLEREVAVKVLDPQALGEAGRARLLHEARAAAKLNHPNIVTVHDVGDADGIPFIVMELVEGPSLHASRPSAIPEIVRVGQEICAALEHAHAHGLVHRDLKPENILGHTDGPAKLTDFGLARPIASRITSEGALTGTVFYLAPEQALGQTIDGRADLYALGVMLYELVAGRLPFTADDPLAVVTQHLHAPVVPPSTYNPELPLALESLILSLMSKQADDRPSSAGLVREALAAMDLSAPGPAQPRAVLNGIARGRFVGREPELALCKAAWLEAAAGARRVVIIEGEAGVGKTRLARELASQVAVLGGRVLPGECYAEGAAPYAPIGEAIRQALAEDDGGSLNLPDFVRQDLTVLSPSLRKAGQRRMSVASGEPQVELQRLCESVVSLFQRLSKQAPVMLLVEDLQWADSGTLCLLRHLAHRAHVTDLRLLAVLTFPPVESVQARVLYDFLRELERNGQTTRIGLEPFTRDETRRMLEAMFQREITGEFLEGIQQETGGNPFFVEEACKALVMQGKLFLEAGRWERGKTMAELAIPQTLRTAILSSFSRLSTQTQDLLRCASIIGQDFDLEVLRLAGHCPTGTFETCLEEAEAAHFLRAGRPGVVGKRFGFAHGLMPKTIAGELGSVRAARLHGLVGRAIEQVYAGRLDECAGALGRHFASAGQAARAVNYLLMAGDEAQSVLAFEDAIADYERAIPLLQQVGDGDCLSETYIKLGSLYQAGYRYEDSRQAYRQGFARRQGPTRSGTAESEDRRDLPAAPHPLRVVGDEATNLDPGMLIHKDDLMLSHQLFSGLVEWSPEKGILPEVAWRWEILENGRTFLFHLRDDWGWSDGVPVTAHDFEFAWRRILDPRNQSGNRQLLGILRGAGAYDPGSDHPVGELGVQALDDLTLRIELEEPAGYFLHLLALPSTSAVPRHVVEVHGSRWTDVDHFVSNGAFILESRVPGERWMLRRNPAYPGRRRGNLQQVVIALLREPPDRVWNPSPEVLKLYEQDRLDVASLAYPESLRAKQRWPDEEVSWPDHGTFYVSVNCHRFPLNDSRVRRALGLGMDRALLAELTFGEDAVPADGGFVALGLPGHTPGIGLGYDPEEARALLADAGFPEGRGFPCVHLLHPQSREGHKLARNLIDQWRTALGIQVELESRPYPIHLERAVAGDYDLYSYCWIADYPDPDSFLRLFGPKGLFLDWSEDYARLVTEAAHLFDQRERFELYARADRMLCEQALVLPIIYTTGQAFIKPWIRREPKWYQRGGSWKDVIIDPHDSPPQVA